MFRNNPLRFASQPDDSFAEKELIEKFDIKSTLVWSNGGCSFLNLKSEFPSLLLDGFDPDVVEVEHLKSKISCLKRKNSEHLNLEHNDQEGLNQSGKFESLLRIVRRFFFEFVVEPEAFHARFWNSSEEEKHEILDGIFKKPAWERAFSMFFSKPSLEALVGGRWSEDSCLRVRENIENLLRRSDVYENYFLKQFFFGEYDENAKPPYLKSLGKDLSLKSEFYAKDLWDLDISTYNMISIGAYLDFLSLDEQQLSVEKLKHGMKKGESLVLRSLQEEPVYLEMLEPDFLLDHEWGKVLLAKDKSFLFSHLVIAIKQ